MAKYYDIEGKNRYVDLLKFGDWAIVPREDYKSDELVYDQLLESHLVAIKLTDGVMKLSDITRNMDYVYPNVIRMITLDFNYDASDVLKFCPIATDIWYSTYCVNETVIVDNRLHLNTKERRYFTKLLRLAIGDKHDSKMQKIMTDYYNATDRIMLDFINDVTRGREVSPITVGYLSVAQCKEISNAIGKEFRFSPRCLIDEDTIRHIIKRHGANGKADQSLEDKEDIARMPYILANFDEVSYEGRHSEKYRCSDGTPAPMIAIKKRINGTYYIIEAVNDGKRKVSHIVSAFISK